MATAYPLPDGAKIIQLLGIMFDGLDVKPGGTFDQTPAGGAWFGVFVTDAGAPVALCGADANLAASFGGALSMLPVAAAKDAAKARQLTDVMIENVREIMNICTRLVMDATSPHLKLDQLYPTKSLPAAALALLGAPQGRREFQVQLPKYGGGVLTVLSA
ncbi:MAG TPA: hypothetical protein VNV13_07875 [Steroidobacteraceae bacterium]|jgi:hypothetical protein|nr:hypothetical protein [Steroidobacteraceae bacterium]